MHTEGAHSTAGSDVSSRPTHGTTHESNAGLGLPPPHDSNDDWSDETIDELRAQVAELEENISTGSGAATGWQSEIRWAVPCA